MRAIRKKNCIRLINLRKFKLKHKLFAFFLTFFSLLLLYIRFIATPIIIENTVSQMRSFATRSINNAIAETMNQNLKYSDLVTVLKDGEDNVSFIEANSVRINLLSKAISRVVMTNFMELTRFPLTIALGAFSGLPILSGSGPRISYSVNPYGEVISNFTSDFESAGINQTHHKINLVVSININIVMPFKTLKVTSASEVLLCESLIVGKIPEIYLNSSNLTDMLNLIPERFGA